MKSFFLAICFTIDHEVVLDPPLVATSVAMNDGIIQCGSSNHKPSQLMNDYGITPSEDDRLGQDLPEVCPVSIHDQTAAGIQFTVYYMEQIKNSFGGLFNILFFQSKRYEQSRSFRC